MTVTKSIPAAAFAGLDIHHGDTLHVIQSDSEDVIVEIDRHQQRNREVDLEKAIDWIRESRGIVELAPDQDIDDLRDEYLSNKFDLDL